MMIGCGLATFCTNEHVNMYTDVVYGCVLFDWPDPVGPGLAGRFACGRRKRNGQAGSDRVWPVKKNAAYISSRLEWRVGHVHAAVAVVSSRLSAPCACVCGIAGELLLAACQNNSSLAAGYCTGHVPGHVCLSCFVTRCRSTDWSFVAYL